MILLCTDNIVMDTDIFVPKVCGGVVSENLVSVLS